MTFRGLEDRLRSRLSAEGGATTGIARWPDKLIEPLLYRRALKSGAGALSLAVVAWIMASIRVGDAVREDVLEYGGLSYQGWRRLGMRDVVLPELERLRRENRPLREVAAELAFRTVQQHLQITWSRLQVDLRRDVALLTAEGNKWFARGKGFVAGRTASRIQQALGKTNPTETLRSPSLPKRLPRVLTKDDAAALMAFPRARHLSLSVTVYPAGNDVFDRRARERSRRD